jgi:hypothetical protein
MSGNSARDIYRYLSWRFEGFVGITTERAFLSHPWSSIMNIKSLVMASAGLALVVAPVAASAAPANAASALSVSKSVRASTPTAKKSNLAGGSFIIIALAAVAVAGGLYLAIDGDDNNSDSN